MADSSEMVGEFPANDNPPEGFKTWQEYYKYNDELNEYKQLKAQRERFAELDAKFNPQSATAKEEPRPAAASAPVNTEQAATQAESKADNAPGSQSNPLPNSIKKQADATEGQWIQTKKGPYQLTANDIAWAKKQLSLRPSAATTDATNASKPIAQAPSKVVDSFSDANAMSAAANELNRRVGNRDYTNENEGKLLAQKATLLKQLYQVQTALNKARK